MNLVVSEKFYSIQGEGQTMGRPAVFLRLAGCNLLCKSDNWVCDSIEVWQKGTKTPFKDVFNDDYIKVLKNGAHLIITGGEPLLHQKKIIDFLIWFNEKHKFKPIVEFETNGTIMPHERLIMLTEYWNVSPKLSNSGETANKRINEVAIEFFNSQPNTIFKFVVSCKDDILEILNEYNLNMKKVVLMPAGDSQELLNKTRQTVAELAIELGLRYSDRLHIVIWNQKTGV